MDKILKCSYCEKEFTRAGGLGTHKRNCKLNPDFKEEVYSCEYCKSKFNNKGSLIAHERNYCKENKIFPKGRTYIKIKTDYIAKDHLTEQEASSLKCSFCNCIKTSLESLFQHKIRCKSNPDKIDISLTNLNKYNEDCKLGLSQRPRNIKRKQPYSIIDKLTMSIKRTLQGIIKPLNRQKHSEIMKKVVQNNLASYSHGNNITYWNIKKYEVENPSLNKIAKVIGSWEKTFAEKLNESNISWINESYYFSYIDPYGNARNYIPDFYLHEFDIYIEIKGHAEINDYYKWIDFTQDGKVLVILSAQEFIKIKKGDLLLTKESLLQLSFTFGIFTHSLINDKEYILYRNKYIKAEITEKIKEIKHKLFEKLKITENCLY